MDYMEKNDYTLLSAGTFFQYPINRESVTFTGKIKETGKRFLYRIYDREIFLHLLKRLRGVKRETETYGTHNDLSVIKTKALS